LKKFTSKNLDVKWAYDLKKTLQDNFSNRQWAKLSQYVVDQEILKNLDKGNSPVEGARRLTNYSESYTSQIKGKLGRENNKSVRPVNLALTGSMLSNYDARAGKNEFEITLGIHSDAPELDKIKAEVHNTGTESGDSSMARKNLKAVQERNKKARKIIKNLTGKRKKAGKALLAGREKEQQDLIKGTPRRPFVPLAGESYTRKITLEIRKLFAYCLDQAIKRSKNR